MTMTTAQLHKFFQLCDPDGSNNSVNRESFRKLCNRFEISDHDADGIFDDLDHDRDGRITFDDFSRGFSDFLMSSAGIAECEVEPPENNKPTKTDQYSQPTSESNDIDEKQHDWAALTKEAEILKENGKGDKLKWLLDELESSEKKHLVPYLENAVEELLSNLQRLQEDNEKLEESWRREKLEHERHVKLMADEMDNQVKEAEMNMRLKAQTEMEDERKSLQTKMDAEMDNLQAHLVLFDKVNSWLQKQPPDSYDARFDEVRNKLSEAVDENRQLRMSLLDTQTSIALMRSELLQLRTLYEEKCRELSSEREKILEVLHEQDHLTHQLSLLHDANRRLQDTNDALRSTYEQSNDIQKKSVNCSLRREKSGSIIGDYIEAKCSHCYSQNIEKDDSEDITSPPYFDDFKRLRRAKSMDAYFPTYRRTIMATKRNVSTNVPSDDYAKRMFESKDFMDQDEGFSSTPESSLLVKEDDNMCCEHDSSSCSLQSPPKPLSTSTPDKIPLSRCESISEDVVLESEVNVYDNDDDVKCDDNESKSISRADSLLQDDGHVDELPKKKISDIIKELGFQQEMIRTYSSPKKTVEKSFSENMAFSRKSLGLRNPNNPIGSWNQQKALGVSGHPSYNANHQSTNFRIDSNQYNGSFDESLTTSIDEEAQYAPDGSPDKMFNVIFIGDAGVGKSSFALRISKGVFMRHMSATLGVDFLMRTIKVDNCNVELRLWDTAGQERFRSVTTSYFRKADGVMLLYDCTCEQSFLNVRQWVKDVDVSRFYRMMASDDVPGSKCVTSQNIPLMIVGNKIDMRPMLQKTGRTCVSTQQGEKLAKDCGANFTEASAKDGTNVMPTLISLVRCMLDTQDLHCSPSTMQLSEERQKKGCCGK